MKNTCFGLLLLAATLFTACKNEPKTPALLEKETISVNGHQLSAYLHDAGSDYVAVFESGLGDGVQPWRDKAVLDRAAERLSVIGYNRAGYADSEAAANPRDIAAMRQDLEQLLAATFPGKKYLLVGHSLGGVVVRDFALKNPDQTAALLFVDPSHESYNHPTQDLEDMLVNAFGPNTAAGQEARQIIEDMQYAATLPDLPNRPTVVLSSMQTSPTSDAADRQIWYDAHQELGAGLSDFTHIATTHSGHYIQREEPELVLAYVEQLLAKLP